MPVSCSLSRIVLYDPIDRCRRESDGGSVREEGPIVIKTFNGQPRDELLNDALFRFLGHARQALAERITDDNAVRPRSAIPNKAPNELHRTAASLAGRMSKEAEVFQCCWSKNGGKFKMAKGCLSDRENQGAQVNTLDSLVGSYDRKSASRRCSQ